MAACDALISAGGDIVGVLAIFSYGFEQAGKLFTEKAIPMDTLSNYRNLLREAALSYYISEDEKAVLESWNNDPYAWAEKYSTKV